MSLMIFFWVLMSGWMYVLWVSAVPQTAIAPMRWGEDLAVVDVFECGCGEEFVGVFEALHDGLEFLDDVGDGAVVLEVVLHEDAKELGLICLFEGAAVDMDVKL